ncbi:MAG: sulfatase-like hydrolase/transferase [Verrucomicrobiota bacterium]
MKTIPPSWASLPKALLLALLSWTAWTTPLPAADPPNIVFIFADDLGFGDLGSYGHPYAQTPALDRLAAEGTRFTRFYVSGVTCCPSRTGFMTGLHTSRFQQYPAAYGFGEEVTITELLQKRGYRTAHFGKWHIGPKKGEGYGIDFYSGGIGEKKDQRGRDAGIFDAAIQYLEEDASGPFYMNIWGHITHYAVDAPDGLVERFDDLTVDRSDFAPAMQHKFDECLQIGGHLDESMREYVAELHALDLCVERLLATLDRLGLRENTIVVFSSDHGPAPVLTGGKKERHREFSANMLGYAGGLRGGKHDQLEGGIRSPFIVRWPGRVPAGRVDTTSVISGLDWLPTLASIVGIREVPTHLDGEDVSRAWAGQERLRETPLFWRVSSSGAGPSMLWKDWKLHLPGKRGKTPVQLYDIAKDPSESQNLAADFPEVTARLTQKTQEWVDSLPKGYAKLSKQQLRELEED